MPYDPMQVSEAKTEGTGEARGAGGLRGTETRRQWKKHLLLQNKIVYPKETEMILWTIQSEEVYQKILNTGYYRCDFDKADMKEWKTQYDWLSAQMKKRIGEAPAGVEYPVWAWYQWEGERKKPDLRRERWGNGWKGERFACLEIDVPDGKVLLSDFDTWSIILLDGFISNSEEEDNELERKYNALSDVEKKKMKEKNWEGAFDLTYVENGWITRGDSIQATFWELKREQIRKVRMFTSAAPKPDYLKCED